MPTSTSTSLSPSTPLTTFHPFPSLLPELRTLIWSVAITPNRTVRIKTSNQGFYSPTPPPAVTRVNTGSRTYSPYKKSFTSSTSSRYIWISFPHDTIHIHSTFLWLLPIPGPNPNSSLTLALSSIVNLRIEFLDERGEEEIDEEDWWYHHLPLIPESFPSLVTLDLLVPRELRFYAQRYIEEGFFGEGVEREAESESESSRYQDPEKENELEGESENPKEKEIPRGPGAGKAKNVRIVHIGTGEWIDGETAGVYLDWVESFGGQEEECMTRLVDWDVNEETRRERMGDVRALEMPRPRIALDYP